MIGQNNTDHHKTLIFVGAHPDDETFGVGATLAQYAASGVAVHYVCATRGEAGSVSQDRMKGYDTVGDLRWAELECAAKILGLASVIHLGYRDSGMPGSADNKHPQALLNATNEQLAGRIVEEIRKLKPQVVVTFDPIGGYRHPDHIAIHEAAVKAFYAAGDTRQYPETGLAFQPKKLYFHVFPRRLLKLAVKILPLFGQDPHRLGRNKDIDFASLVEVEFPVHAVLRLNRSAVRARDRAAACHASQIGGGPRGGILGLINKLLPQSDSFMRAYPPPSGQRESDLFTGVR